jgi:hypothetical protein
MGILWVSEAKETPMNEDQTPTETEEKTNPYFGRKCFRTGK